MTDELQKFAVKGHVLIKDDLGNILLNQGNAIHFENMSLSIAQSLARHVTTGPIKSMVFGNGAASISGVGTVTYLTPNTSGSSATLYNQTYEKIVNDQDTNNADPLQNKIVPSHVNGALFSDLIISCTLETGEPSGQNALDNASDLTGNFVFNEIGLINYDGKLLSHIIHSPVEKSTNRSFLVEYTLRFQLV